MSFFTEAESELNAPLYTFEVEEEDDENAQSSFSCSQGHRSSLQLQTSQGGTICLLCFCNLISNPNSLSLHISFALSQLSIAISQPQFLHNLLNSHAHLLISSLTRLLCSSDDDSIARKTIDLVSRVSNSDDPSVCLDFVARIADLLVSSGSLSWNRRQIYTLHCLGVLLNYHQTQDPSANIKDKKALINNLIAGLQLPSEETRGEILFVLYKLSVLEGGSDANADYFLGSCPRLLYLSLDVLVKTQSDEVRMNCVALLTVLAQRGFLKSSFIEDSSISRDADTLMQSTGSSLTNTSMFILFAEAIKGPLLSSDIQVQIGTLDLIFYCLCWERSDVKFIDLLVEESIADFVFEILRLSGQKDPLVNSCLKVLDLLSAAEEPFSQRLTTGFPTLLAVLSYIGEVPLHPVQSHTLKLIGIFVSNFPGIISRSQVEEVVHTLTGMLRRHTTGGELGMLPETFMWCCSIFVSILKSPSSHGISTLTALVQEASKNALSCLSNPKTHLNQLLLYSLFFFKEAHKYCHEEANFGIQSTQSKDTTLENFTIEVYETHLLPWLKSAIDEMEEEENILGMLETFHAMLLQGSATQTRNCAETLASSSCFSLSFGCLGLFPTEKMKWRVYLMLSSLVDGVLGHEFGQPLRDAALYLPSDPLELLFLLGQKSSYEMELNSCQSAVLLILYCMSLYDDRLAEGRQVLASLEQYILVNGVDFLGESSDSTSLMRLVHLYAFFRGVSERNYQTPCSSEAERLLFHLVIENELDMLSARTHPVSLRWLFQQEKISKPLSNHILNFCRLYNRNGIDIIIHGYNNQTFDIELMAALVAIGDNLGAALLVYLLKQLQEEEGREEDLTSLVNVMILILNICPSTSDQLCLHGIGRAIYSLYRYSSYSSSPQIFKICSLLIFNILRSVEPQKLLDPEVWLAITIKLLEVSIPSIDANTCNQDSLLVIGILCLILHHSNNSVLTEASKLILLSTSLVSAINDIVEVACSKGPSLVDHDEETSMGETLIFVLLLYYFSLRSMHALLPGPLDWQDLFEFSSGAAALSVIHIRCDMLCRLLYFGSPPVKLVASYCLLELLTRITDHLTKQVVPKCSVRYLKSMLAVLESLVFDCDAVVAINCGLCLSIILGWEALGVQETIVIRDRAWHRLVVEELTLSLTAPSLASRSFTNQHKAATHVAAALLKLNQVPKWMKFVFDDSCISGIITNLSVSDVSGEMVQLFHMLLLSDYLKEEHISGLYHVFQACRKQMYSSNFLEGNPENNMEKVVSMPNDLGKVYRILIRFVSCDLCPSISSTSRGVHTKNQSLLDEIEMFLQQSSSKTKMVDK